MYSLQIIIGGKAAVRIGEEMDAIECIPGDHVAGGRHGAADRIHIDRTGRAAAAESPQNDAIRFIRGAYCFQAGGVRTNQVALHQIAAG